MHIFKVRLRDPSADDEDEDERNLHSISLYSFNSTDLDSSGASSGTFARAAAVASEDVEEDEEEERGGGSNPTKHGKAKKKLCNISRRRQQDSESNGGDRPGGGTHLEGCLGNVRRHRNEVDLVAYPDSAPVVHLREVQEANSSSRPTAGFRQRLMDERMGPLVGLTETAVKFIAQSEQPGHR